MSDFNTNAYHSTTQTVDVDPANRYDNTTSPPPVMEQAKQQAKTVVEQTQQKAGEVIDQAKNQTKSWAEDRKQAVAQSLSDVANAVMQTGENLRGKGPDTGKVADMTDYAAQVTDKAASYLRDTSVDQMIGEVESFGRREPMLFLVGAAALGFVAARFLKSSGRAANATDWQNPDRSLPAPMDVTPQGVQNDYDATSPAG